MCTDTDLTEHALLVRLRISADAFVARNLLVLSCEVLEWRRTGVLRGDKLRELAGLCRHFIIGDDELQTAEYLVQMAALTSVAAGPTPASPPWL